MPRVGVAGAAVPARRPAAPHEGYRVWSAVPIREPLDHCPVAAWRPHAASHTQHASAAHGTLISLASALARCFKFAHAARQRTGSARHSWLRRRDGRPWTRRDQGNSK